MNRDPSHFTYKEVYAMSDDSNAENPRFNDTRRAAERYLRAGLAVIPVPAREKNPNRQGWQRERHTMEDIPKCWNNGQNIGVLTGEPSGWLVDIDLDCPEALKIAGRFLDPTLTSGREHPRLSLVVLGRGHPLEDFR